MASLAVQVHLNNVSQDMDHNAIVDMIEQLIKGQTGLEVVTTVYDNDGQATSNPIYTYESTQRVR